MEGVSGCNYEGHSMVICNRNVASMHLTRIIILINQVTFVVELIRKTNADRFRCFDDILSSLSRK